MAEAKTKSKTEEQVLGNQVLDVRPTRQVPATVDTEDADLGDYAGAGSEAVRPEDAATPFLVVLQSNSPQCKKSDARYVNGAEEGMFCHTLTKRLYDGRAGLEVIDVFFEPLILRWKPRDAAGGGGGGVPSQRTPRIAAAHRRVGMANPRRPARSAAVTNQHRSGGAKSTAVDEPADPSRHNAG